MFKIANLYRFFIRKLLKIFLHPIDIPNNSRVGVVTYGGKTNIEMILISYYSFCFHIKKIFPLTIINDGTFNDSDYNFIISKLPNANIISATKRQQYLKIKKLLSPFRYCNKYRFLDLEEKFNYKLFDPFLSVEAKKIIYLDCDTIFLREPKEILKWVKSNQIYNLHSKEAKFQSSLTPEWRSIEKMFCEKFSVDGNFNSGFLCINKDSFSLETINNVLSYLYQVDLFGIWLTEQFSLSVLFQSIKCIDLSNNYFHFTKRSNYAKLIIENKIVMVHFAFKSKVDYYPFAIKELFRLRFYRQKKII